MSTRGVCGEPTAASKGAQSRNGSVERTEYVPPKKEKRPGLLRRMFSAKKRDP